MKRELIFSPEYIEFEQSSTPRAQEKLRYAVAMFGNRAADTDQVCEETNEY